MVVAFLVGGGSDKEDEKDAMHENDISKEAIEAKPIFIPLGFPYKLPRTYYKGTDPEWQSFIQLSKDKKQCNNLKCERLLQPLVYPKAHASQTTSLAWWART